MMKKITGFILFLSILFSCKKENNGPQPKAPQFNKLYGGSNNDRAYSFASTPDSGYILAGVTNAGVAGANGRYGEGDVLIIKLDKEGNRQWQKTLGGSQYDAASSVITTQEGDYIMTGITQSNDRDITQNHGGGDVWVVKLDRKGTVLWQKTLGGSNYDAGQAIVSTSDGGYAIAAFTSSDDGDVSFNHYVYTDDYWIIKLDKDGTLLWERSYGGTGDDVATSIITTSDGGFVVAGNNRSFDGDVSNGYGLADYWVLRLDINGNLIWEKSYGGSRYDEVGSIVAAAEGGYVLVGSSGSSDGDVSDNHGGNWDVWAIKIDTDGHLQWQKALGGSKSDHGYSLTATPDGGYILAGSTSSEDGDVTGYHKYFDDFTDAWVVRLDKNGNKIWQRSLGGQYEDAGEQIIVNSLGSYVMAGYATSNDGDLSGNHGNEDAWVMTLNDK